MAVPPDRDPEAVREFGCWTADLIRMAEWLRVCGIDTVAMQEALTKMNVQLDRYAG